MRFTEGTVGRVFILRLEDGEVLNDTIEAFAREHDVSHALVTYLGGSADGSKVVVGPDAARPDAVIPLTHAMEGIREVLALGTLSPMRRATRTAHARRRRSRGRRHRGMHPRGRHRCGSWGRS